MAKKKTLRQQDFQKKKLKVGKGKQQPTNITDTSFVAKQIRLPTQRPIKDELVNEYAKTVAKNAAEHAKAMGKPVTGPAAISNNILANKISLLKHHSPNMRKEALLFLSKNISNKALTENQMNIVVNNIYQIIIDDDVQVRNQLIDLLDNVGSVNSMVLELNLNKLVLYLCNSMTHIIPQIQRGSGKFLKILVKYCHDSIVRRFWCKILVNISRVLGWSLFVDVNKSNKITTSLQNITSNSNSLSSSVVSSNKSIKSKINNLEALNFFIKSGCQELFDQKKKMEGKKNDAFDNNEFYLESNMKKYLISEVPQPYQYLKLFETKFEENDVFSVSASNDTKLSGAQNFKDLEKIACEDYVIRCKLLNENFMKPFLFNLAPIVKDGGESGKVANTLLKYLETLQTELNAAA